MQSLGSFDRDAARDLYRSYLLLAHNDVAQVHRYSDLGARWSICHGAMDILAADAIGELINMGVCKPLLLAEGGAVQPKHTRPFAL